VAIAAEFKVAKGVLGLDAGSVLRVAKAIAVMACLSGRIAVKRLCLTLLPFG